MLIVNHDGIELYTNQGGLQFVASTDAAITGSLGGCGSAWGDWDSDGDLDLLVTRGSYRCGDWFQQGNQWLQSDFNNGPSQLYENQGDGSFTRIYRSPLTDNLDRELVPGQTAYIPTGEGRTTGTRGAHCGRVEFGDYNGDGHLDVLIAEGGLPKLYRNTGSGAGFVDESAILPQAWYTRVATFGDYVRSRLLEWPSHPTSSPHTIHRSPMTRSRALGRLSSRSFDMLVFMRQSQDRDGRLDIFFGRDFGNPNLLARNLGNSFTPMGLDGFPASIEAPRSGGYSTKSAAWGDFDVRALRISPAAPTTHAHATIMPLTAPGARRVMAISTCSSETGTVQTSSGRMTAMASSPR